MLDRPGAPLADALRDTTERWIEAFDAALAGRSAAGLSALLVADSHWRNLFGISWYFATFSGNATIVAELLARGAEVRAANFRIDQAALAPRNAVVGGREVVEAIFTFDTANGPGYGAVRLLRQPDGLAKAWTFSTSLDFDSICEARASGARGIHHPRFRRPRLARSAAGGRRLRRPRSRRAHRRRRPCRHFGRGRTQSYRAFRAGDRPRGAHRRQLAPALSRAEAAQQDAGQSSALSAVPDDLSGLHPEGQDRELAGELCRHHGGRLLDALPRSRALPTTMPRSAGPRG